jgi:hypothetical protein
MSDTKRDPNAFKEAVHWHWKFSGDDETMKARVARLQKSDELQLAALQREIKKAVRTGDAGFFKDFAYFLENPSTSKLKKRLRLWIKALLFDDSGKQVKFLQAADIAHLRWEEFPNEEMRDPAEIAREVRALCGKWKDAKGRRTVS